jgi:vitamin B12 transporter
MKRINQTLTGLLALLFFLSICTPAIAQQQKTGSADTTTIYEMKEVIISASKYEQSPESVGRNVTVISQEEIQQATVTSVSDLLADQQSIHMIGAGQTPGSLQQGFIRNTNSNHSVVMIDGVRISDPSTNNNAIDLSELSLTGIRRIEIVRGSHSTLYGSSAIGGVINIITKKQSDEGFSLDAETKHGYFGESTYSTTNSIYARSTSESGLYTNFGFDYQHTNGLDATIDTSGNAAGFNPQDQDGFDKLDIMGKVGYKTDRFDVYGSYRRADQRVDADQGAYQDDSNAYTDFNRDLFSYGAGINLSQNLKLDVSGAYSNLDRKFVNDSSLVAPNTYDGIYTETSGDGTLWENELKAVLQGQHARLVAGASASQQTMSTRSYTYSRSQFGVFESRTNLDSLNLKEVIYNGYMHTNLNGGLISESLEPFSLVLGGRYVNHDEFGSHLTYEINPQVQLFESTLIYGAITSGFNAPSLYQLYSPAKGGSGFTDRGNQNLEPETSVSYEVGVKQQFGSSMSVELSAFKTRIQNVIQYVYLWNANTSTGNLTFADYLGDTYLNASEQNIAGLEASVSAYPIPKLQFQGNVALTQSTITLDPSEISQSYTGGNHVQVYESGRFLTGETDIEDLTRRPSISAFASATYLATDVLQFKVDSRFVGSRNDVFYSASLGPNGALDRRSVSNYNITDFSIRYEITSRLSVTCKVENLFDTQYQEINGYQTRGRGFFFKASFTL